MPVFRPGVHPSVAAMFRSPGQRLLSAFAHMASDHRALCCAHDWGISSSTRAALQHLQRIPNGSASYAHLNYTAGCAAKMLIGRRCNAPFAALEPLTPNVTQISRAVQLVRETLAFVGLQERWAASICLWHARFGGRLVDAELADMRPTPHKGSCGNASQPGPLGRWSTCNRRDDSSSVTRPIYDEAKLAGFVDVADEAVYAAAVQRFDADIQRHEGAVADCLRSL